jgi:hypothetical protein
LRAKSYLLEGEEYLRPEQDALDETACRLGIGTPGVLRKKPLKGKASLA